LVHECFLFSAAWRHEYLDHLHGQSLKNGPLSGLLPDDQAHPFTGHSEKQDSLTKAIGEGNRRNAQMIALREEVSFSQDGTGEICLELCKVQRRFPLR
jgi:hypothetical protein